MNTCRTCDKTPYIAIRWKSALQLPDDSDVNAIARNQVFVKKMKFGRLHRCKNCGQYWFLDDEGVILWRVNADMTDLLFQWDNTSLLPNKAPIKSLQKIGSSQITRDESINIPCGIITKTGEFIEPASVEFSKFPPLSGNQIFSDTMDSKEAKFLCHQWKNSANYTKKQRKSSETYL